MRLALLQNTNKLKRLKIVKIKIKTKFHINGLLKYFDNTSCHYRAKIKIHNILKLLKLLTVITFKCWQCCMNDNNVF